MALFFLHSTSEMYLVSCVVRLDDISYPKLGKMFGVTEWTIALIIKRKTWKEL